jgi:outer membrane receptor protein involved in Fe transport
MNNFRCKYIFILLAISITAISFQLKAQSPGSGKLTGRIIDAQTNETIPFASAVIMNRETKANVATGQTDINGNLQINGIPDGIFTIKISYVGYQTLYRDSVSVNKSKQLLALGTVKMKAAKGTVLNEVQVTAKKAPIQLGIDKKVFAVDQSLVSQGGSASDLLTNVPSVQVDVDGNVSLRGSTGVRVLIDGKPSLIGGGDVSAILASIPASSIETVEVITNPSSKYDAEGNSGIINIVLKRNSRLGFNGNVALTAGNRDNYNGNASLSFQNKNINIYGNYGYRYGKRIGGGFNNITYLNRADSLGSAEQLTTSNQLEKSHNVKAGIDYYLTKKDILSFSAAYNKRDQEKRDLLDVNTYSKIDRAPILLSDRINTTDGNGNSYDLNFDYSHKFKPSQELTFNFGYSHGNNDNFQQYNTTVNSLNGLPVTQPEGILTNDNDGRNKNYNIQADYNMPLGKLGKLESGYRSQIRYSDNNTIAQTLNAATGGFENDYQLSNLFNSKEQVHALYTNYSNQIKNFGYQIGLRGEVARLNTNSGGYDLNGNVSNAAGRIAYDRLYPSIFLTQKFKGEQQLQLSYTRRVNRPRPWDTNPFIDYSDPLSWRQGNPNLLPEDVHSYELGYSKFWSKLTLIGSIYSRHTNDLIQRVRSAPDSAGVIILRPLNLTQSTNSGVELIAKVDAVKAWSFTANINGYHSNIKAVPDYNIRGVSGYSWNANLTNNFTLPGNITLQIRGDYNSTEVQAQGKRKAMYGVDGGAKYNFPNKKASLSFNMRDIFNTRRFGAIIQDSNTITDFQRYQKGQMGNLTFSYRFGQTTFQKKQKKQEQEQRPDEASF